MVMGEHSMGHTMGDEVDWAAVGFFKHLSGDGVVIMGEEVVIETGNAVDIRGDDADVVGNKDDSDVFVEFF